MRRRWLVTCVVAALVSSGTGVAGAQQAPSPTVEASNSGPSRQGAIAGVRVSERQVIDVGAAVPQQGIRSRGKPISFMITGAAAFIGGLLIGDDIGTVIAVGGLGLGVYGLYLYSR
jgi:hypothetical protein